MSWGPILIAAFLVACVLAAPAAAQIKRYTDSQGVIRITNLTPSAPQQITAQPTTDNSKNTGKSNLAESGANSDAQDFTEVPNAPASAAEPILPKPAISSLKTDNSLLDLSSYPQQAASYLNNLGNPMNLRPGASEKQISEEPAAFVPAVPETPQSAPPVDSGPGLLPVLKTAYEPNSEGIGLPPPPQLESLLKPESGREGGIRSFRDHQGILVITNVARAPAAIAPAALAEDQGVPGKSDLEAKIEQTLAIPRAPNLRPVSFSQEQTAMASLMNAAATAKITASASRGTIRRYKDKDGVLQIENVEPRIEETPASPAALAMAGAVEETVPPQPDNDSGGRWAGKTAVLSGEGTAKPPPLNLAAADSLLSQLTSPAGVQRYRDLLGIWQIKASDGHWVMAGPMLSRPAAGPREVLQAVFETVARLPENNRPQAADFNLYQTANVSEVAWVPVLADQNETASPKYRGIAAVRDNRGVLTITNAPPQMAGGNAPSRSVAHALVEPIIQEAARAYRLPPTLIRAVIQVESNFVHLAVSPKGAMGLMQLMPGTAQLLGVQEPFNPRENIHGGCRYLRMLIDTFRGSLPLALAAYNAGPQRVVANGYRVPEITETQDFLTQVIGRYLMEEKKVRRPLT